MQLAVAVLGSVETAQILWHSLAQAAAQQDLLSTHICVLCLEEIYQQAVFTWAVLHGACADVGHAPWWLLYALCTSVGLGHRSRHTYKYVP